jgi:XTP/dITP diphosphohydrolase
MQLVFATNNANKIKEIRSLLGGLFEIITLQEAGIDIDIPEPHDTLEENAREKSSVIYKMTGHPCFSEDTGLEVMALGGAPGVLSARYAGEQKSAADNITKLLQELKGKTDRSARFRTVISLIIDGQEHQFEGVSQGRILEQAQGNEGFGYDPVFAPDGEDRSFAEMGLAEKNQYSHRARAFAGLAAYLKKLEGQANNHH